MTKITTYNKGIIIDGHADTKEECETITLLCDSLAKDSNFKQVAYDKGYAAFQKVGKTNNLMFPPSYSLTVSFDSGIESVAFNHGSDTYTFLRSGETYEFIRRPGSNVILDVTLKNSYGLKSTTLGTISNNTITIPEDEFVEVMTCQITSVAAPTVVRKSYDLSTSAKWATLSSGNHNVQIVAKASGYRDSEKSAAVTVNKPTATVTLEAGTYKFASSPVFTDPNVTLSADFAFSSIGVNYINVTVQYDTETYWSITYHSSSTSSNTAYSTDPDFGGWVDISMRTITLSAAQAVSADFYKWAITDGNLVKQESHTIAVSYNRGAAGYFNLNGTDLASSEKSLSLTEDATIKLYVTSGDLSAAAFNVIVDGVSVTVPDNKTIDVYKQDVQISVSYDDEHSPAELALTLNYHASEQPSASETWVLNETITSALVRQTVNFVSSESMFVGIKSRAVTSGYELTYFVQQGSLTVELPAYDTTNGWLDTTYRTITFATAPSGDLLTWLQANGTKQRASTGYSVTYNGTLSNGEGSGKYFKVQCDDNEAVTIFDDGAYSETNPVLATNVNKIKFIYGKHAEYPEASNYNWILSSVKLGMQLNYINTSDDDGLEEKETVSEWYTLTENIDDLVFSKKSLITFTIVTAVNGSVVTYNDCVGEAGMLFSDWLTSSYNTHNVTYPVTTADCGSTGYEPATLPSGRTIPVADGVPLWLIQ